MKRDPGALKADIRIQQISAEQKKRLKEHPLNKPIPDGPNAIELSNKKLRDLAEQIGIDPDGPQIGNLWDAVKGANGFQIRKTRGGGKKNSPSDTRREDIHKLATVAVRMHKDRLLKSTAAELCGIDRSTLRDAINRNLLQWELLCNDREIAQNNLEMFNE